MADGSEGLDQVWELRVRDQEARDSALVQHLQKLVDLRIPEQRILNNDEAANM